MNFHFFKYFLSYIIKAKTRQKLLFVAIFGLLISSFSLVIIQGVMGGLQSGLIERSKRVMGHGYLDLKDKHDDQELAQNIFSQLESEKIKYFPEYEIELLIKNGNNVAPVILHGIDLQKHIPEFLKKKDLEGIVVGSELSSKLDSYFGSDLQIITPQHTDFIFGDLPRQVTAKISDFLMTDLTEIDSTSAWVRLSLVQNLIRSHSINRIRVYSEKGAQRLHKIAQKSGGDLVFVSWEKQNETLVWALGLETKVMLFLFIGMSLLVAISITSGFMLFFDKVKNDMMSFWILGKSRQEIMRLSLYFTQLLSFSFTLIGLCMGLLFLLALSSSDINFMPSFFVERSIPVDVTVKSVFIAFIVPYFISSLFSYLSFSLFRKENSSFINLIRKVG